MFRRSMQTHIRGKNQWWWCRKPHYAGVYSLKAIAGSNRKRSTGSMRGRHLLTGIDCRDVGADRR